MSIALMTMAWKLDIPGGRKMVLLALADSANDQGDCYPSVSTLAQKCSQSERSVQGHITALEQMGFLSRMMRKGRSTMYLLHPRKWFTPAESAPPQNLHPTPATVAPPPPQNLHPTPADFAPITQREPSIEPSGEPTPPTPASKKPMRGAGVKKPDADFEDFWKRWPKRVGRQDAEREWQRLNPDLLTMQAIGDAVERILADPDRWAKDGQAWQVLPHPCRWLRGRRWEDDFARVAAYSPPEMAVMAEYNAVLPSQGWPEADAAMYLPARAAAIRAFLSGRPGKAQANDPSGAGYFSWMAQNLKPMPGLGFDWAVKLETYARVREGNFSGLEAA